MYVKYNITNYTRNDEQVCHKCGSPHMFITASFDIDKNEDNFSNFLDGGNIDDFINFTVTCTTPFCRSLNEGSFYNYDELKVLMGEDFKVVEGFVNKVKSMKSKEELKELLRMDFDNYNEKVVTQNFTVTGTVEQLNNLAVLLTHISDISAMGVRDVVIVELDKGLNLSLDKNQRRKLVGLYGEVQSCVGYSLDPSRKNILHMNTRRNNWNKINKETGKEEVSYDSITHPYTIQL